MEQMVPPNLIKTALMSLSNSPESFFVLRNNYAISFATMNIANWILGIGDRHLSNILIDMKSGKVFGELKENEMITCHSQRMYFMHFLIDMQVWTSVCRLAPAFVIKPFPNCFHVGARHKLWAL